MASIPSHHIVDACPGCADRLAKRERCLRAGGLGHYFQRGALAESVSGWILRVVSIGALALLSYIAFSFASHLDSVSFLVATAKASFTVPGVALAIFSARQSSEHFREARRLGTVGIQLQTIAAYTEPLGKEQTSELLAALGSHAFGTPTVPPAEDPSSSSLMVPLQELIPLLQGLVGIKATQ